MYIIFRKRTEANRRLPSEEVDRRWEDSKWKPSRSNTTILCAWLRSVFCCSEIGHPFGKAVNLFESVLIKLNNHGCRRSSTGRLAESDKLTTPIGIQQIINLNRIHLFKRWMKRSRLTPYLVSANHRVYSVRIKTQKKYTREPTPVNECSETDRECYMHVIKNNMKGKYQYWTNRISKSNQNGRSMRKIRWRSLEVRHTETRDYIQTEIQGVTT